MRRWSWVAACWLLAASCASAQQIEFRVPAIADDAALATVMRNLASEVMAQYRDDDRAGYLGNLLRLQIVAGGYAEAAATFESLSAVAKTSQTERSIERLIPFGVYAQAKAIQESAHSTFAESFNQSFRQLSGRMDDAAAIRAQYWFGADLSAAQRDLQATLEKQRGRDSIELRGALDLVGQYVFAQVYRDILPLIQPLVAQDDRSRYIVQDDVLIRTKEGATLSAVVIRKKGVTELLPATLLFNIYTDLRTSFFEAKQAAVHGYVGVVADGHGKRLSPDQAEPWEHDAQDTYAVIDWISKQPWSNGKVGMYGGSYMGFAQWAATRRLHPALKTIVPTVATHPGLGLPLQNGVFQLANYGWNFYVTNNKYLDYQTYNDRNRWASLNAKWYASGRPYREIDRIDGAPNKLLQRQLQHPSFDRYWQSMTPYGREYAKIDIPVLSITGYFDDAQVPAVHYLTEHTRYNRHAEHYLLIGPYTHPGAMAPIKPAQVNGYTIDPVAQFDTAQVTYEWFDYVMRGGRKPALLKDKINYEVMGANVWKHAPSIAKMSSESLTLYLTTLQAGDHHRLARARPKRADFLEQKVDFADRSTTNNLYPGSVLQDKVAVPNGFSFVSDPFEEPTSIAGMITGEIKAMIDKRDMDLTLAFYEITPDGRYFTLAYFLGRASYAKDLSARHLLTPGKTETIPIDRTPLVSRQLSKGSRLLVLLNVNKNQWAQINYGTGKDVSDESLVDATEPLHVRWRNDSHVTVPIAR